MTTVIKTDVVIIGTGPAGLTAAYDLITMGGGLDVTILEASNKIGGRMQADTTLTNFPVELGAEWIQVRKELCAVAWCCVAWRCCLYTDMKQKRCGCHTEFIYLILVLLIRFLFSF